MENIDFSLLVSIASLLITVIVMGIGVHVSAQIRFTQLKDKIEQHNEQFKKNEKMMGKIFDKLEKITDKVEEQSNQIEEVRTTLKSHRELIEMSMTQNKTS